MTSSLGRKIHLAAFAAGVISIATVLGGAFLLEERLVRQSLHARAELMLDAFKANLHYAGEQVSPLLQKQLEARFLPEAVPFYAAARASGVSGEGDGATLRMPTTNPTNEADRPSDWEAGVIASFVGRSDLSEFESERRTGAGRMYTLSRPIVAETACLTCHGDPGNAPRSLIKVYGSENGFGWRPGDIVGVTIVSLPVATARQRTFGMTSCLAVALTLSFGFIFLVLDLLAQALVVRPLQELAGHANAVSCGKTSTTASAFALLAARTEEIGVIARSFERMHNSLDIATRLLTSEESRGQTAERTHAEA